MRIKTQRLAKIADFIGKPDLEGMPTIVNVLHHLRRLEIRPDQWRIKLFVERRQGIAAGLIRLPDDGLRRVAEILDGRTLP